MNRAVRTFGWLCAILLVGGAGVWWVVRERGAVEPQSVAPPDAVAPAAPAAEPDSIVAPEVERTDRAEVAKPASGKGALAPLDPATSLAFTGRVVFPAGTPADERAHVVVTDQGEIVWRVDLDPSGSFRALISKSSKRGRLKLEARYLLLDEPFKLVPAKVAEPIVLEPRLGACIRGTLRAPEDAPSDESAVEGLQVNVSGTFVTRAGNRTSYQSRGERSVKVDSSGLFEFGGLEPGLEYEVRCDTVRFPAIRLDKQVARAGEVTELELALRRGVRIHGRVVDEAGLPVEGATVNSSVKEEWGESPGDHPTQSAPDGSFALQGIPAGEVGAFADKSGFVTARSELSPAGDGQDRRDVVLVLRTGIALEGDVTWPDGKPAANARVAIEDLHKDEHATFIVENGLAYNAIKVDENGHFRATGFAHGPFRVTASAKPEVALPEPAPEAGTRARATAEREAKRAQRKQADWNAVLEGVPPDTKPLALVLRPPTAISGTVVDDLGAPIDSFTLTATPGRGDFARNERASQTYAGAHGEFTFERLHPGVWVITVSAKGYGDSEARRLELPGASGELRFVCWRSAIVTGSVLDPEGKPVRGAQVSGEYPQLKNLRSRMSADEPNASSDKEGRFELLSGLAGTLRLTASKAGFAPSEPLEWTLDPGAEVDGVVLRLQVGGRIAGQLILAAGRTTSSSHVYLLDQASSQVGTAEPDSDGRFLFEDLAPGHYQVGGWILLTAPEAGNSSGTSRRSSTSEQFKRVPVDVFAGQTAHVVLGGVPEHPVELSGRVTAGGKAVAGAFVSVHSPETGQVKTARTDDDGRYTCMLDEPGDYRVMVTAGAATVSQRLTVPDQRAVALDVVLGAGRIAGRVVNSDGKPLAGVRVQLSLHDVSEFDQGGVIGFRPTDADGRYAIGNLAPGVYDISAGGTALVHGDGSAMYGRKSGMVDLREKTAVEDSDFVLGPAGRVEVLLRGGGEDLQQMQVYARDANGRSFAWATDARGDVSDPYLLEGVGAGTVWVGAQGEDTVATGEVAVAMHESEVRRVELELVRSGSISVSIEGAQPGAPGFRARVLDARGLAPQMGSWVASKGDGAVTLGLLAPGTYTLIVESDDGRSARQEVKVASGETTNAKVALAK